MFLSIIIPHYNLSQTLLRRCIDSILATQTPKDCYEIIVIDDGSQTPPRWISETYDINNIRLIESEHRCQGAARNIGIDAAKGEYIMFVDADDTLQCNNAIQQCIKKLQQERPDIMRFKYQTCTKHITNKRAKQRNVEFGNTISGAVYMEYKNLPANVWCYFIKKELLTKKEIRFTTDIYHEDEEFSTITHYHAKTLIESNANIYNYCIRRDSTITGNTAEMVNKRLNDRMTVLENLANFRDHHCKFSNSIQKRALQRKLTTLVVDAIVNYMRAGKSVRQIQKECIERITPFNLYPIAKGEYGYKFKIFRVLANNKAGLHLLRLIIQSNKPATK